MQSKGVGYINEFTNDVGKLLKILMVRLQISLSSDIQVDHIWNYNHHLNIMCVLTLPLDVAYESCSEVLMLSKHEGINA